MTSLYIDDFKLGLDVRKSVLTAQPGSLRVLDNCVVNAGGEIEKAKSWVHVFDLPAGLTKGLVGTDSGLTGEGLWTFALDTGPGPGTVTTLGTIPGSTVGAPIPVKQMLLAHPAIMPAGNNLLDQVGVQEYGVEQFFVSHLGSSTSGSVAAFNWWNGVNVPDFVGQRPLTIGQKMYRLDPKAGILYFSGVGDPSVTNPLNPAGTGPNTVNPGAGFIDVTHLDAHALPLVGMEMFFKQTAVFSRHACLLFQLDPDPANNVLEQTIRIGAFSGATIRQFGTGDVLFLNDSGVRSLRSLNQSLAAGVTDVGSPIDPIIQAAITTALSLGNPNIGGPPAGVIEPLTGRYMLAINNVIYVLSYWPSSKINAWSTITMPGGVKNLVAAGNKIYARIADAIYQYGGANGTTYDTNPATVITPLHAAETPTTEKKAISISAMSQGNWNLSVGMDADNPTTFELAANLTKPTYAMQRIPFAGFGTHIGFKLTCADAAPALLGALSVQFDKSYEE